jgi:hypothetical protein
VQASALGWQLAFDDPIELSDGRKLVTLRDAANYITGLSIKEAGLPEWQNAIQLLMAAAEEGGIVMMARIGMMRALNNGQEPPQPRGERA